MTGDAILDFVHINFAAKQVLQGVYAAFGLAVLLAAVKPSFVFLALVPLLPVAIFLVTRNPIRQKITLALGIALSAAMIAVPEHFLSRGDERSKLFLPTNLFVVHADLIRDQLADDVAKGAVLPYQPERGRRGIEISVSGVFSGLPDV